MTSLQRRISAITRETDHLVAQLCELDRLREQIRKAQLAVRRSRRIDHRKRRRT